VSASRALPASVDAALDLLAAGDYVADRGLATALFLSLRLARPLFLEGEAGVGKTEVAKVLARMLGRRLLRLQCYEGLDLASAAYEWDYPRQMLEIRVAEAAHELDRAAIEHDLFSERFLVKRPLLQALEPDPAGPPVLLIDEIDRADEPFEAFLLEVLSDFQVTIPEIGPITAAAPPLVVITSNRTREVHDALKRRCFYAWIDYPDAARELAILRVNVSGSMARYSRMLLRFLHALTRERDRVHSFTFATRLTPVTRYLRHRDPDEALAALGRAVRDWEGGTRIGACLRELNLRWSRRLLGQGALVLLVTDGLDRDDARMLADETRRLRRSCRRLVWLNPLLRFEGFEPRAAGIRAMLPHVDDFRPVHDLESLAQLAAVLAGPIGSRAARDPRRTSARRSSA